MIPTQFMVIVMCKVQRKSDALSCHWLALTYCVRFKCTLHLNLTNTLGRALITVSCTSVNCVERLGQLPG